MRARMEARGFERVPYLFERFPNGRRIARRPDHAVDGVHSKPNGFHVKRRDRPAKGAGILDQLGRRRRGWQGRDQREQRIEFRQ